MAAPQLKSGGWLIRGCEVYEYLNLSKSGFYAMLARGSFPPPSFCTVDGRSGYRWTRDVVLGVATGEITQRDGMWVFRDGTPVPVDERYRTLHLTDPQDV